MIAYVQRVRRYIRRYGAAYTFHHAFEKYKELMLHQYDRVWQKIRTGEDELIRQREHPIAAGLISVVVPVYNTDPAMLHELVDSLLAQTYQDWELCLYDDCSPRADMQDILAKEAERDGRIRVFRGAKNQGISGSTNSAIEEARGQWVALLDHDDLLTPDALYRVAEVICDKQPDLIYSDEDKVTENGAYHTDPHFKPDFCPDNLRSGNYICHLMVLRKTLVQQVGGLRTAFNGSQDHDLTLRCAEKTDRIVHIPRVLYQWRTVGSSVSHSNLQKCINAACAAVQEHMGRIGWPGWVDETGGMLRLHYEIKGDPTISVILLGDDAADVQACRAALEKEARAKVEWLQVKAGENRYAAMNAAAAGAKGDVLLFVDASLQVQTPDFMTELLMYAQRDDVGAVTPVMWDKRGRLTHGGFAVGMEGIAVCRERELPKHAGGWHLLMRQSHNISAMSAVCLMIRKDHFIPFDEGYRGGLGAVDWCLRLQKAGYRHVFTPHAGGMCVNKELLLLGKERDERDVKRFTAEHGSDVYDPCYSRMFSRKVADGTLREDLG